MGAGRACLTAPCPQCQCNPKAGGLKRTAATRTADATGPVQEALQGVGGELRAVPPEGGHGDADGDAGSGRFASVQGGHHGRSLEPTGHRWDQTKDKINFHGGQVSVERQRLRSQGGGEVPLPS